jgi:phosphoribosylformylglycinamidine synthase subunit PurL
VKGMGAASRQLGVPIVSGNVSLYNETSRQPVYPTPMIGCVGVLEDIQAHMHMTWDSGQRLWLVGDGESSLGGSEYLAHMHQRVAGMPPALDLEHEVRLIRFLRELAGSKYGAAVHDLSSGGLAIAITEMALLSGSGVTLADIPDAGRHDLTWFGESAGRVLVAVDEASQMQLRRLTEEWNLSSLEIGTIGGDAIVFPNGVQVTLHALKLASDSALAVGVEAEMA